MKRIITLALIVLGLQNMNAQCTEEVTGFGNNTNIPMYNIEGDVMVTVNAEGETVTLDLAANFMTAAGPDIRAFFVNSGGLSDTQLTTTPIANLEHFEFGLVGDMSGTSQNGAKTFTVDIPESADLSTFDKIFFYCLQFNQFWDFGTITPFSAATCDIFLAVEDITKNTFSINPNPANTIISIERAQPNTAELRIFDVLGNVVLQNTAFTDEQVNVSNLTAGIYIVSLLEGGKQTTRKLIVQ